MVTVKEMSLEKKRESVESLQVLLEDFALPLVGQELGSDAARELVGLWRDRARHVSADASPEEKYDITYLNWERNWQTAYDYVSRRLGEAGQQKFERAAVDAWKRRSGGLSLYFLRAMRAIAGGFAFTTFAKQMAYELQAFTPFTVTELTGTRMVATIPRCKMLDATDCEDACLVGCQRIYPAWMREQFQVDYRPERTDHSCTVTFTRA